MHRTETARATPDVSALLQHRRDRILGEWERSTRELSVAADLSRPRLLAHVPDLLSAIGTALRRPMDERPRRALETIAEQHALVRMRQGFDLYGVTGEITTLRACILRAWEAAAPGPAAVRLAQDRELEVVLDRVLLSVVQAFAEVQGRALRALDRVASVSLESSTLDALLHGLASTLVEELPSVECASIRLFDDGALRVRAAVGTEEGRVLLDVPLMRGDERLGVARVGSSTADALSKQDRLLIDSMVSRATAGIHQQIFLEAAERRARELEGSEARLRQIDARLRLALEVAELEPWDWDRRTGKVTCSRRLRAMLGLTPDQRFGARTLLGLLPPDERHAHAGAWRRALDRDGEGLFAREHRIIRPIDGEERWLSVRARPRFDEAGCPLGVFGTVMDITEQKRAEERTRLLGDATEALSSSLDYRETLKRVAEALVPRLADGCAIDLVRPDGTLGDYVAAAHADPAKVELVREARRRMLPRPDAPAGIAKVIRTGEPELIEHVDREFLAAVAQDPQQVRLFGSLGLESLLMVPIGRPGHTIGAITLAQVGSGRRFRPDDLALAEEIADRAATAIENARLHQQTTRAAELRERLLSLISHDLRTPLTAIQLASALLIDELRDDDVARARAEVVRRNAKRIGRLVNDLVDLSHLQEGRLTLELRDCALGPLLAGVVDAMRPVAAKARVELRLLDERDLGDARIRCDRPRLRDALSRVLEYAVERAGKGHAVTLRAERSTDRIVLTVTGPGIGEEAEAVDELFELYWRGTLAAERAHGLGLFIARGVIEAHGGRMWVERDPGDGRRFIVSLRLHEPGDRSHMGSLRKITAPTPSPTDGNGSTP